MVNQNFNKFFLLFALLGAVIALYFPGVSGTFLLDDYSTLPPLAQWGEINSIEKFVQFVFGGHAGPAGRPIPLATFALNSTAWPTDAFPFIVTNVFIHALNTLLVFLLIQELNKASNENESRAYWLPLLVATLWGLHPYQVSTVLYVVQRMTLLAAGFSFLSLFLYLRARVLLAKRNNVRAAVMLGMAALASLAALYSKENAVLIPLQLLLLEMYLRWTNAGRPTSLAFRATYCCILLASLVVICALLSYAYPHIKVFLLEGHSLPSRREFTFFERQLTELRIVGDYIVSILVPKPQTAGVFQDGYVHSRSIVDPISTLVWLFFHVGFLSGAWALKRHAPLLAFGIFWFYIGHMVESTVVMLELKFEHRNYLPSLGLLLPIAAGLLAVRLTPQVKVGLASVVVLLMAGNLLGRTVLWGNPTQAALVWVKENPNSPRALENAAMVLGQDPAQQPNIASLLKQAAEKAPHDPVLLMKYLNYICGQIPSGAIDWGAVSDKFKFAPVNWQIYQVLEETLGLVADNRCELINLSEFNSITASILRNREYAQTGAPRLIRELNARAALIFGEIEHAKELYASEVKKAPPLSMAMRYALWLASYDELVSASNILTIALVQRKTDSHYLYAQALDMKQKIDADIEVSNTSTE